jgi:hypothetical protein
MGDDGDVVVGEKEGTAPHRPECADLCVPGIGKVVTITTEVVSAVQQPDHPIHYYTRSLLEVVVQRLSLLAVVAFASHRSQSV